MSGANASEANVSETGVSETDVIDLAAATPSDLAGVAAVVRDVWHQEILLDVAAAQIENEAAALLVARKRGDVVGFVSAFLTVGATGRRRWEVDLLAVRAGHHGEGIGTRLIQRACRGADGHGAALARAAVRVNNVASRRVFQNAGFSTDGTVHQLLLWPPKASQLSEDRPQGGLLLRVETLTYRGLWIEGLTQLDTTEQRRLVTTARAIVAREDRFNTGSLIPAEHAHRLARDLWCQASVQGEYQWFMRPGTQNVRSKT